jgi:hypothetical protein
MITDATHPTRAPKRIQRRIPIGCIRLRISTFFITYLTGLSVNYVVPEKAPVKQATLGAPARIQASAAAWMVAPVV